MPIRIGAQRKATLTHTIATGSPRSTIFSFDSSVVKIKQADETVTSSITLQNDDDFFLDVNANEEWIFIYEIGVSTNLSLHGVRVAVSVPLGSTLDFRVTLIGNNDCVGGGQTTSLTDVDFSPANLPSSGQGVMRIVLWVKCVSAGTIKLLWAQSTNSAIPLTFRKGSQMVATRIG